MATVTERTAPYEHIACCIDDSEGAAHALAEARRLRALGLGRLSVVTVAAYPLLAPDGAEHPEDIEVSAERWLVGRMRDVPEGEPVLLHGFPPVAVCEWAREARPDLLVAGAHRSRVERALLGSFAAHLAHHAPCAVLLVRPVAKPAPPEAETAPSSQTERMAR
jgi:nucleotide-binding universal stress UspA family protein